MKGPFPSAKSESKRSGARRSKNEIESNGVPMPCTVSESDDSGLETIVVQVRRSAGGLEQRFTVKRFEQMKVLDLLVSIQRTTDPSIAFRYSCRVAMCGTCALRVDGHAVLACQTPVPRDAKRIHLAPLAGFPVVRDLVVDMRPFFDRWASIVPYIVPFVTIIEPAGIPPTSPERKVIDPALDCITCGICYSACSVSGSQWDFVGPAALNRAMVLIADSRDSLGLDRLRRIGLTDGIDRCHYISACASYCPKGLDPFSAILRLRRWRLAGRPVLEATKLSVGCDEQEEDSASQLPQARSKSLEPPV